VTLSEIQARRLRTLLDLGAREGIHLSTTDARLFASGSASEWVARLAGDTDLAERVDAFVARFARFQDTLGDKLIPLALEAVLEPRGSALDNIHRAEKLGWIASAARWIQIRQVRNLLIHEYELSPDRLGEALDLAHHAIPMLTDTYATLRDMLESRQLLADRE
jgi:uncharacterized protein with HEPN domain